MTRYDLLATEFLDQIFPPLKRKRVPSKVNLEEMMTPEFTKAEKFSQYTYWRSPPGEVVLIDDNDLASYEFQRSKLKSKNIKRRALSF
uniref:Uncharacterized protein n=1 Tax=Acrobeloides nanus TaxID=290746 RepID=A0A914D7G0_9BILA